MALKISKKIADKLAAKKPPVTEDEILECFTTRSGIYLEDEREDHKSDPPTMWFVSETFFGRKLKICFIHRDGDVFIRTAYAANAEEIRIYAKYGKQL